MAQTKIAQCYEVLRYNPDPTTKQIEELAIEKDTSTRNVYRALERVRAANMTPPVTSSGKKKGSKKSKKSKKKKTKKSKITTSNIPSPKAFKVTPKTVIPLIPKNMTFEHFSKYHSFPFYNGLYRWQVDWFKTVWRWKYSLTLVSRDHGKSIGHSNLCQWAMTAKNYDILYLGWTSRRRDVAQFVYNFFLQRDELVIDKASSPYHFKTVYGTQFDTFSVKSKEILGKHEIGTLDREIIEENRYLEDFIRDSDNPLLLIIDDAIDNTFWKERHKEIDLEQFYRSTIANINPDKSMFVGTHKFEGDFYYFLQEVYEDDIVVYKRTPFLDPKDPRYGKEEDNPSNLLCPERWIHESHPDYGRYLDLHERIKFGEDFKSFTKIEQLLIKKKDLTKVRKIAGEYWWGAEYMQDPHPITGEIWEKVHYAFQFKGTAKYDMACFTIDRATTVNKKSDETGIVTFFREKEVEWIIETDDAGKQTRRPIHNYLVTNDLTQKIRITDLVLLVDKMYKSFIETYRRAIKLVIVVEKQGGGDDFIALAEDSGYRWAYLIKPVHNTRNKWDRIEDNLGTPITNANVLFLQPMETSKLVGQILHAPYSNKVDAIDALSNGYFECEKIPVRQRSSRENAEQLKSYRKEQPNSWERLAFTLKQKGKSVF